MFSYRLLACGHNLISVSQIIAKGKTKELQIFIHWNLF